MKRLLFPVLVLGVVVSLSAIRAADSEKESGSPGSPYYPLKIGTQWTYQVNGSAIMTMKVYKHEKIGDATCGVVESTVDGKVVATEHIAADDKSVCRLSFNGQKSTEPLCILKLPLLKDQMWKFDVKIANETLRGTFKIGEEDVTVPAGTYKKAITASAEGCEVNGNKVDCKYWFVPNIGIVKQTMNIGGREAGGREIVSELKEFKPGK